MILLWIRLVLLRNLRSHTVLISMINRMLCKFLVSLIQSRHRLLCFQMTIEGKQLLSKIAYDLHLFKQYTIQTPDINFYVTTRLVNLVEKCHFVLDHAHDFIDMPTVWMNQLLLFFKDLLNELLMVCTQFLNTLAILSFQLTLSLHMSVQWIQFNYFLRSWLRLILLSWNWHHLVLLMNSILLEIVHNRCRFDRLSSCLGPLVAVLGRYHTIVTSMSTFAYSSCSGAASAELVLLRDLICRSHCCIHIFTQIRLALSWTLLHLVWRLLLELKIAFAGTLLLQSRWWIESIIAIISRRHLFTWREALALSNSIFRGDTFVFGRDTTWALISRDGWMIAVIIVNSRSSNSTITCCCCICRIGTRTGLLQHRRAPKATTYPTSNSRCFLLRRHGFCRCLGWLLQVEALNTDLLCVHVFDHRILFKIKALIVVIFIHFVFNLS